MLPRVIATTFLVIPVLTPHGMSQTRPAPPEVVFELSPQTFGASGVYEAGLADFDGDGDLDAVLPDHMSTGARIWFNDGNGVFTNSGQLLYMIESHGVGLADFDRDGDVDIFMTCANTTARSKVYLNNGSGVFTESGQVIGDLPLSGNDVHVFDIDRDGDIDALIDYYLEPNKVYENDGTGIFLDSAQVYPEGAFFADLDRDGDTDILECDEVGLGYRTWLHDGHGGFSEYAFLADPSMKNSSVAFGDLDGDSDIDAVVTNGNWDVSYPTKILLNDGTGVFTASATLLTDTHWGEVCIGDLNNDGHTDIVLTSYEKLNQLYVSNGDGSYAWSELGNSVSTLCTVPLLGDVNNDSLLDFFAPAFHFGSTQLWLNRTQVPCCVGRTGDANGEGVYPDEVTLGDIMLLVDVKFVSGDCTKLACIAEADVNQDGGDNPNCDDHVTLGDIMTLVDFLFITGPENATLPECL
jgi:hypothetical protein